MSSTFAIDHAVERMLRHDRMIVLGGLILVTLLAWAYLYYLVLDMDAMMAMDGAGMASMMQLKPWSLADAAWMFAMWTVMMVGMMLPSATPTTLVYAAVARKAEREGNPVAPTIMMAHMENIMPKWAGVQAWRPIIPMAPGCMSRAMSTR